VQERKEIMASGAGAVGFSLFASLIGLCCVGPWTVAVLGVSGAIAMARWQPFRPLILIAAGAMLAWAFWRTYRLRRMCLANDCTANKPGPAMHIALWFSTALLLAAVFAPQLQALLVDATPPGLR